MSVVMALMATLGIDTSSFDKGLTDRGRQNYLVLHCSHHPMLSAGRSELQTLTN